MNLPTIKTKEISAQYPEEIPVVDCIWAFCNHVRDRELEAIAGSLAVIPAKPGVMEPHRTIKVRVKENSNGK